MTEDESAVYGDRYELRQLIAKGGMAEVYLAHDRLLDRPVAVKRLFTALAADSSFVERFEREAKAAAKLNHPNIVSVYDWGEQDGRQYLVMEYVEGRSLAEILQSEGRLHPDRAADIAIDMAAALSMAHREGMVHKDIKPGNVMIATDGRVQVLDFGIARAVGGGDGELTQAGTVMGTATYFSPEQAQGQSVGPRGDLYSLGVVLYEMTVGRPPFQGDAPVQIAYQHVHAEPPAPRSLNPDVPVEIEAITLKLLAKDPDGRYPTADDVRADLRMFREGARIAPAPVAAAAAVPVAAAAEPEPDPEPLRYEETPRRTGVFLFFMIILLLTVAAGLFLWAQTLSSEDGESLSFKVVPTLAGLTGVEAVAAVEEAGFEPVVQQEASSDIPSGTVISQDPSAGSEAEEGSEVTIAVSSGPGVATVPAVVGLTEIGATQDLKVLGFEVTTELNTDDSVPEGLVLGQDPPAGTDVSPGSTVLLTISEGADEIALPDVQGLKRERAETVLAFIECVVTEVLSESSIDVRSGRAIRTDPLAGTVVTPGDCPVILVMSTGG